MLVLVSYDVQVTSPGGTRRLRRIARACQDYGQRVQFSVFEIEVAPDQWILLRARLLGEIDASCDSLRFYFLGSGASAAASTFFTPAWHSRRWRGAWSGSRPPTLRPTIGRRFLRHGVRPGDRDMSQRGV
jgi:CRISPR-associated protein Cas2